MVWLKCVSVTFARHTYRTCPGVRSINVFDTSIELVQGTFYKCVFDTFKYVFILFIYGKKAKILAPFKL